MRILHISDTHSFHKQLPIDEKDNYFDIVICSGDCSNTPNLQNSIFEIQSFIEWFKEYPCGYKVYVAGNHDTAIERGAVKKEDFAFSGIYYLQNESVNIKGFNIYGSPYTPTFMNWSFMKARNKMHDVWQKIPEDTDILITHGPPKGVLDVSEDKDGKLEFCGDMVLLKRIMNLNLKLHCFGHIHNGHGIINTGTRKYNNCNTIFSNASCVTDAHFDLGITFNGNIIEL